MRSFIVCIALLFSTFVLAAPSDTNEWFNENQATAVVRAYFDNQTMLQTLADRADVWTIIRARDARKTGFLESGYAIVEISAFEKAELITLGFRLELDAKRTLERYTVHQRSAQQKVGIDGFECYRTVTETYADAAQLASDFPDLAEWIDIGDSWEKTNGSPSGGEDMRVLKITNQNIAGPKPVFFAMSAVHARELTTAELNTRFAEYLLNNYATNADARWLVDHHEIHLSLQSNPDGRVQAEGILPWRKNTNENYCGVMSQQRGADLNRNFEFGWGCCGGSSTQECSGIFRGASAASEPEVAAIQAYVRSIFPDQREDALDAPAPDDAQGVFLDIHSFSELVIYPWGLTTNAAPNNQALRAMARKIAFFNDYLPLPINGLTIADGSTVDFAYGELGVAAFGFELGTTFFQDCGDFEGDILNDNLRAMVFMAKSAREPYLRPQGPDVVGIAFDRNAVIAGGSVTINATATDERFSDRNGVEPTQNIASANAYIDTPPWDPTAVALPLIASDGAFDSGVETISASLDLTGLSTGEHLVYLEATDASGRTGLVSAAFVYVIDPANAATIAGTVTGADTGTGLAAVVRAGTFQATTDASSGGYALLSTPGNYTVSAIPASNNYSDASVDGVASAAGSTTTVDFELLPFCLALEDDVETDTVAWTTTGDWARTNTSSNSPTFSWTDSPGGNYLDNLNVSLTSPLIDLSQSSVATLSFAQRCDTEAFSDFCIVEITTDGVIWTELARYDGFFANPNVWTDVSINIDGFVGSSNTQVRFRLQTDGSVGFDGWYVDDINIRVAGNTCLANVDSDGDGIVNSSDNCTLINNPSQLDVDGDNYGNSCDADFNNDGITNFLDVSLFAADFLASGVLQTDLDGNGVVNFIDFALVRDLFLQPPGPSGLVAP